jgi:transposase
VTAATLPALDVDTARAATDRLRLTLTDAHEQLIDLYRRRAHEALGYGKGTAGWSAYCAAEFGELLNVRLPRDTRGAVLAAMVDAGMSQRQAAAPFAVSLGTVNAALQSHRSRREGTPAGGVIRVTPPASKVARVLELLAAAGTAGLTVEQVRRKTRWHHGQASATLCRLAAAGRIDYRPPARRGLMGAYLTKDASL